jgi:hypothetical protein
METDGWFEYSEVGYSAGQWTCWSVGYEPSSRKGNGVMTWRKLSGGRKCELCGGT